MHALSPSGLKIAPQLVWGSHLAQFFATGHELREVLVPFFKAGLENHERCLWVTGEALTAEQARSALRAIVPDLDRRERAQQIEITDAASWYSANDKLRPHDLVAGLVKREQEALAQGYAGLRTSGNCAWVSSAQWQDFQDYEQLVQTASQGRRMISLCSYCTDQLRDGAQMDVLARHHLAVPSLRASATVSRHDVSEAPNRQKSRFDLAMAASNMGTWRYTLADNICVYDANAQRLYGLTKPIFLHDEDGVKAKFHADDMDLMWSRVSKALDPKGDGRYDVEYRVRQLDGSWRWLSAWGLVEFEGNGDARKPVAIVGASRDLTEQKQAEQVQQLVLNELNHRVKNTLASIQAITAMTLRGATDLPTATAALDQRIQAMAKAHDLLTARSWSGARLGDIVRRAMEAFPPAQVTSSGPAFEVSPQHVLGLSLALHELATNATKYGALSRPDGRVDVSWAIRDGKLQLDWVESGGPPVEPPTRSGFGSLLLDELVRSLGGTAKIDYDAGGVHGIITVGL